MSISPVALVQAQLEAFNAKDVDALLGTYSPDAEHFGLHGQLVAKGHDQLRHRFTERFSEPDLHARLVARLAVGNVVVDSEIITRNFPEGRGTVEMLCIYEIANGLIQKASFSMGEKSL